MRRLAVFWVLSACVTQPVERPPEPAWTTFEVGEVTEITTRFLRQEPFEPTAEERADVEARCPRLHRARALEETKTFHLLTVEGEGLDNVVLVNAWLPDDKLAVAQHRIEDGALVTPLGCDACTLVFGIALDEGRVAACTGPGYSLTFAEGKLTSP